MHSSKRALFSGWNRARKAYLRALFGPRLPSKNKFTTIRLGSDYGGWRFLPLTSLTDAVVVSAGVGEDISFDVELASLFGCHVLLIDPTPRAIAHFRSVESRIGLPALRLYSQNGLQPVEAYDLSSLTAGQLQLDARALTAFDGTARFYAPKDPTDVSYSIVNFQNDYKTDTDSIEVPAVSVVKLIEGLRVEQPELLKLDIEGAEIQVVSAILQSGLRPRQLLIEYDELNWPSRRGRDNFNRVHGELAEAGYVVTHFDRRSCVSYIHEASLGRSLSRLEQD